MLNLVAKCGIFFVVLATVVQFVFEADEHLVCLGDSPAQNIGYRAVMSVSSNHNFHWM